MPEVEPFIGYYDVKSKLDEETVWRKQLLSELREEEVRAKLNLDGIKVWRSTAPRLFTEEDEQHWSMVLSKIEFEIRRTEFKLRLDEILE